MTGQRQMLSVGIDIGTTTSQLVLSRLTVTDQSRPGMIPRLGVDDREVLYQSDPQLTPLRAPDEVDVEGVLALIRAEYVKAGVDPSQVETGAVIITGETARTRNADAILAGLSDFAGDFVVTVAGPSLESQIAGRGSGAAAWSAQHFQTVVNVDVGGGSANAAVFRTGKYLGSAAAMVGGRQIILDPGTGVVTGIKVGGAALVAALGLGHEIQVGRPASLSALRAFDDAEAQIIVDLCQGRTSDLGACVALTPPLEYEGVAGTYFVSGGVGRDYAEQTSCSTVAEVARYGDIGPLVADALRSNPTWQTLHVELPAQTIRATVLGAAQQQISLSGSTIWAERTHLPLRNLPVIDPDVRTVLAGAEPGVPAADGDPGAVQRAVEQAVVRWDLAHADSYAVMLDLPDDLTYAQVRTLAAGLAGFATTHLPGGRPLVLVLEDDFAQVIGQTIKAASPGLPLIVVDQIGLDEGDYIDIGEPMFDGTVVPVSVKTLVFYQ